MNKFSGRLVSLCGMVTAVILFLSLTGTEGFNVFTPPFFKVPPPPPHLHGKTCYVTWSKEKGFQVKIFGLTATNNDNLDWVAKAHYQNMVNKTGWAFLEVETKATWPDQLQASAAGIAEGYLTRDLIYYHWQNVFKGYCENNVDLCKQVLKYASLNLEWIHTTANNATPYWHQTTLVLQQFSGLINGFRMAAQGTSIVIPDTDFILMLIAGDLGDLGEALNPKPKLKPKLRDGHCSALIKIIEGRDIYFSHVTWNSLQSMLRIIKRYNFAYKVDAVEGSATVPAESISFSSYPGSISSIDDFYVLSSGLAVMETTIINYNRDLWAKVKPINSVFTGIRTMVANRLAKDGETWGKLFSRYNSGTYNNQWMVLNYNLVEPRRPLQDSGILWVLEQLPGMIVSKDVTDVLKRDGYFASYNLPYYKDIFEASGTPKMIKKYGDFFSFKSTPRAKIFARDHKNVVDVESMMKLMRYNDYTHDDLSKCECNPPFSGVAAISSRADLNPPNGTYPFELLGHRPSAGTDMKLTNLDLSLLQQFIAISGPTFDPLPSFEWATSDFKEKPHVGHPNKFEFPPTIHNWKWL